MKYLSGLLAWALYGTGHLAYLILDRIAPPLMNPEGKIWGSLWRTYQWCMVTSSGVQSSGDFGPWDAISPPPQPEGQS